MNSVGGAICDGAYWRTYAHPAVFRRFDISVNVELIIESPSDNAFSVPRPSPLGNRFMEAIPWIL